MLRKLLSCIALTTALTLSLAPKAEPQSAFVQIPCARFRGAGSFSNPVVIGLVNRPVIIRNCPRLSSGRGFNLRYYRIALPRSRSSNAAAGAVANLAPGSISAVHPRLATLGGLTLLSTLRNGFWVGNPDALGPVGRFVSLTQIPAGTYLLGFEKIDSPLRSLQTPTFNIVIIP